jgi:hypothetical protein
VGKRVVSQKARIYTQSFLKEITLFEPKDFQNCFQISSFSFEELLNMVTPPNNEEKHQHARYEIRNFLYAFTEGSNTSRKSSWEPVEPYMADATQRILSIHTLHDQYLLTTK